MKNLILIALFALITAGCKNENPAGWIDEERLENRDAEDWLSLGGNYKQQHYL